MYEEDVRTGERTLLKQTPVLGGSTSADYTPARDVGRPRPTAPGCRSTSSGAADTPLDGTAPAVALRLRRLRGVDAAVVLASPGCRCSTAACVWALAHPRGGGELGRRWYLDGKLLDEAQHVHRLHRRAPSTSSPSGVAAPDRVAIRGGSAGGLLVGRGDGDAARSCSPRWSPRCRSSTWSTTMLDPSLPLTVTEWEEWGDPREPVVASYMAGYAPYENVRRRRPTRRCYVTAGLNDPRVELPRAGEVGGQAAGRRRTGERPLLLRTELGAGHAGPSGRYDAWREEARMLAFLLVASGVTS